jgi:tRNA(Met) C34 N-acetyltransferase TmcA
MKNTTFMFIKLKKNKNARSNTFTVILLASLTKLLCEWREKQKIDFDRLMYMITQN